MILLSSTLGGLLVSCGTSPPVPPSATTPALRSTDYTSFDKHRLPYRNWVPENDTRLIVIGFHGISGASTDMENLGEHLPRHLPGTAVYAADLRGQGNDPVPDQRGDIRTPRDWFNDAVTFTSLLREKHPGVPVVWCGESMGALIALHACTERPGEPPPCDGLILASPVSSIGTEVSKLKLLFLRIAAFIAPRFRLTLESLAGVDQVQVTRGEVHQEQAGTNPWHLSAFTLRLLRAVERMITDLPDRARLVRVPTLILHGGKDIFSNPEDVERFASLFPPEAKVQRRFYPESYHLLFYDHQRAQVLHDTTEWLRPFRLEQSK